MKYLRLNAFLLVLVIGFAVLLPAAGSWAGERICVSAGIANMRSGPGTKFEVLWQVEKYHPLLVTQKKGEWVKVRDFEKDTAWVHGSLLGSAPCVITIKTRCNVRSRASKKGDILFTVEKGVPFKVLERKGNWIRVKHKDGDKGWIYKSLVW